MATKAASKAGRPQATPSARRKTAPEPAPAALPGPQIDVPLVLPRGANPLPREVVTRSQRARIKQAMAVSVASKGYAATTVADLTGLAGVSRTTFYEQFTDKEDCYLACFDDQIRYLIKRMRGAIRKEDPPPAQLVNSLAAFIDTVSAEPVYTVAYMGHSTTVGPRVLEQLVLHKAQVVKVLQTVASRAVVQTPGRRKVPGEIFEMTIHGMYEFMCDEIRAGRTAELERYLPHTSYIWFAAMGFPEWAERALASTPKALRVLDWQASLG